MNSSSSSMVLARPGQFEASGIELFANNPSPRVPVACLLDTSASMAGPSILELQEAVAAFFAEIARDPLASLRVDPSVLTFGGEVRQVAPFCNGIVEASGAPQSLVAAGNTPLGAAIRAGIDAIESRQRQYRAEGIPQFRPWVFLCSDGHPTDEWQGPAAELRAFSERGWTVLAVGVGPQADMKALAQCSTIAPLRLSSADFKSYFRWLSSSLKAESRSCSVNGRRTGLPDFLGSIPVV